MCFLETSEYHGSIEGGRDGDARDSGEAGDEVLIVNAEDFITE